MVNAHDKDLTDPPQKFFETLGGYSVKIPRTLEETMVLDEEDIRLFQLLHDHLQKYKETARNGNKAEVLKNLSRFITKLSDKYPVNLEEFIEFAIKMIPGIIHAETVKEDIYATMYRERTQQLKNANAEIEQYENGSHPNLIQIPKTIKDTVESAARIVGRLKEPFRGWGS